MIIIKIELHSAITHKVTEIGRMQIVNDGTGTHKRGNYDISLMRKGTTDKVQRRGRVQDYPRTSYTVWELVRRALEASLGKWPIHPGRPEEFNEEVQKALQNVNQSWMLTAEEAAKMIEIIENPPEPSEFMKAAAKRYKEGVSLACSAVSQAKETVVVQDGALGYVEGKE